MTTIIFYRFFFHLVVDSLNMNAEHLTCKKGSTEQTQCVFHSFRQRKLIYFEFRISSNVKGYFFRAENDKQICDELIAFLDIHRYHRCWRHVFT